MTTHNHAEAFKLMTYRCERCGHRETIWNSRDGVTPFMISCERCDGPAQHINWQADVYAPEWTPPQGTRVFRDGSPLEAVEAVERLIASYTEQGNQVPARIAEDMINAARYGRDEWRPGWPKLVRVEGPPAHVWAAPAGAPAPEPDAAPGQDWSYVGQGQVQIEPRP